MSHPLSAQQDMHKKLHDTLPIASVRDHSSKMIITFLLKHDTRYILQILSLAVAGNGVLPKMRFMDM